MEIYISAKTLIRTGSNMAGIRELYLDDESYACEIIRPEEHGKFIGYLNDRRDSRPRVLGNETAVA